MKTSLIYPSLLYQKSYNEYLNEALQEGSLSPEIVEQRAKNIEQYIQELKDEGDLTRIKSLQVPQTNFWLVNDNEYLGHIGIRHYLTDQLLQWGGHIGYYIRPSKRQQGYGYAILKLGLEEARKLGLSRILLTCNAGNLGSKKIIEQNGGQFENEVEVSGDGELTKLRYWITL